MRSAIVENGIVANVIVGSIDGSIQCGADVGIGWGYDGQLFTAPPTDEPQLTLEEVKTSLKAAIDAAAEAERRKYITPGSGQAMEYWEAAAQAKAYLSALAADPSYSPTAGTYKMLEASIGIDGETLSAVATLVAGMYDAWLPIGAAIRNARLATKAAIDAAETVEDAQAAADAVVWP